MNTKNDRLGTWSQYIETPVRNDEGHEIIINPTASFFSKLHVGIEIKKLKLNLKRDK